MRHGESKANVQGVIVSHPSSGLLPKFALTETGRWQVRTAAVQASLDANTIIYSSDFSRARETAKIVQVSLGAADVTYSELLRERYFGVWDNTSHENYAKIWQCDLQSATSHENNVEPVASVLARVTRLINEIEQIYQSKDILLVSHGDTLQILQAAFQEIDPRYHRSLPHLVTAEIRQLSVQ